MSLSGAMTRIERPMGVAPTLLYRYPEARIPVGARVIVQPDECAVVSSHGQALGVLGPGQHALDPNQHRFLESTVDIVSGGDTLACEVYLIAVGTFGGVQLQGSLGKLKDDAGKELPLWFTASLTVQAQDPEKLVQALDSRRDDPMEAVKFVAVRALRSVVERLSGRGDIVAQTVSREEGKVKRAAEEDGLGLGEIGVELLGIDQLDLMREAPMQPTAPEPPAGHPAQLGGFAPGTYPGAAPAMPPGAAELGWGIPGVFHLDQASGLHCQVNFFGSFVGTPVPPHQVQWVIDTIGETLFGIAQGFSGNVLEVPHHTQQLSAMLNDQVLPRLETAGLRGQVIVTHAELPPNDPGIAELMRRGGMQ